jgi:uncharacterized phage protein (TIGR02220 family)
MNTLFDELSPEAADLIRENLNLVNENIYDWIQQHKKLAGGFAGDVLRYLAVAKRRKNKNQKDLKLTLSRKNRIARLIKQGATMEDFKSVIDFKVNQWWDTKFREMLRPETLFSDKFHSYLEQAEESSQIPKVKDKEEISVSSIHAMEED